MSTLQSTNYNEKYSIDDEFYWRCFNSNFSGYSKGVAPFLIKVKNVQKAEQRQITPLTQKRLYESIIENLRTKMNLTGELIKVNIQLEGIDKDNKKVEINVNPHHDEVLNLKDVWVKVTITGIDKSLNNQYTGNEGIARWLEEEISQATSSNKPIEAVIGPWLPGGEKGNRNDDNYKLQQNYTAIKNALERKQPLTVILIDPNFSTEGLEGQIVDRLKNDNFIFKNEGVKLIGTPPHQYPVTEFVCDNVRIIYASMFLDNETLKKIGFKDNTTNLTPYIRGCENKSKLPIINNNRNENSLQGLVIFPFEENSFITRDSSLDRQQVVEENPITLQFNNYKAPPSPNEDVDNSNNVTLEKNNNNDNPENKDDKKKKKT